MGWKVCTRCGLTKSDEDFHLRRNRKGGEGRVAVCKACLKDAYEQRPVVLDPVMDGFWTCIECGVEKHVTEYPKHKREPEGRNRRCKACHSAREKVRRLENPEHYLGLKRTVGKSSELRRKYGVSLEDFTAMLEAQGGGCAICGRTPDEEGRHLAVDHNQACCPGRKSCGACRRGLLCRNCNQGLGQFLDNPRLLRRAANYLRQYG